MKKVDEIQEFLKYFSDEEIINYLTNTEQKIELYEFVIATLCIKNDKLRNDFFYTYVNFFDNFDLKYFKNTLDNKRYHTLNYFFKKKFGQKVFKVPLDINSTCPNQYNGGCIYCSNKSVAGISDNTLDILEQFEKGRKIMEQKWPDSLYIPYFQSGTNTYNDKNLVKGYIDKLLLLPKVIGIDIATRPDCLSDEWLDYLDELNKKTFLIVELGLQSSNNNTLKFINRGHDKEIFKKAVEKLHERNIFVVAHIINGLPYEEKEDINCTCSINNYYFNSYFCNYVFYRKIKI